MKIFKQKAGVISLNDCWVCIHGGYMYGPCNTLEQLIHVLNTEWEHDKHIVG